MTGLDVALGSIRGAFQGAIPSPIATVSSDGTPNSTYLSVIWYIDEERVGISNQFLGKTAVNLRANPRVAIRVVEPTTMIEYELDATHLRSERSGEVFEAVRARLEAIAAQSGMEDVFRLKAIEVLRVDRCAPASGAPQPEGTMRGAADLLLRLDVFVRRLSECRDLAEATRVALETMEDLFGYRHSILLVVADDEEQLFTLATNGYATSGVGSEVSMDEGVIGVAARRRRQVRLADVDRLALAAAAPLPSSDQRKEIPRPGLDHARSMLATPLVLHDRLIGVLYLDSETPGHFDAEAGGLVEILAGHLAVTIALLEAGGLEPLTVEADSPADPSPQSGVAAATVVFHDHDGSVLIDGDYIIRGVPGRILFSLLSEHERSGRSEFTNREIRLDRSIGLPAGNDNLEARLLTLRRRLADRSDPFGLERVGRGRLHLTVDSDITLVRDDE
ncbi:GAF domain-containing protein [Ilumatobacter sp.]|uniref:GAF domain-containing protein n=1 Tax=Ilumatobacter sp. TaxID=1967498 RepID=UPI003C4C9B55